MSELIDKLKKRAFDNLPGEDYQSTENKNSNYRNGTISTRKMISHKS
jgi:hypothetical protein